MKGSTNRRKEGGFNSSPLGRTQAEANSSSFYETDDTKKAFSDRMNYLLINSIGCTAVVTVPTGVKYSGLLYACKPSQNSGIDVIMKYPRIIDKGIGEVDVSLLTEKLGETLLIEGKDVAELELKDLDFTLDEKWENSRKKQAEDHKLKEKTDEGRKNGFKTDVDISGAPTEVKERELKKWVSDDVEPLELMGGLEDNGGEWDQFAVNEEKFGITSTFDEHLYTTKINKDDPNYEARLREADRIAKEIESQGSSGNVHLAEERGLVVENSEMDEEDKYSGVDRRGDELLAQLKMNAKPAAEKPQKYVPPSLRNEPHHADPAIISSSKKSRSPPISKLPPDKKSQLDELKKFSEKFNVPYKMPDEIKTILKKNEENASPSSLKVNPSLPPKPTSQVGTPSNVTNTSIPSSKPSRRNSKPSTPAPTKAELKRGTMKYGSQGAANTPISSPSAGRANTYRRRSNSSFFGDDVQKGVRKDFNRNFNMFLRSKSAYELKAKQAQSSEGKNIEPFFIERPYFTTPTWNSTMDKSFKTMFPDERTAIQKIQIRLQQRTMNAIGGNMPMGGVPGMMAMQVGPGGSQSTPFMASPGMFMPFQPQPMFYPPVPQMLTMIGGMGDDSGNNGHSPSPGANSPHGAPSFMNGAGPIGPFAYPTSFQPMMGPIGSANASGSAVPSGSGSSYKGHYHNHNHNHNHNNGNRYHRHR